MPVAELENFRQKYPQYGDMGDLELARKLAAKYPAYRDLPFKVGASMVKEAVVPKFAQKEYQQFMNATPEQKAQILKTKPAAVGTEQTLASVLNFAPFGITVYHGSPHQFESFDASKIGTGQGAQSYGHGLYFAENPQTAISYQKQMASNPVFEVKKPSGEWFKVDKVENDSLHHAASLVSDVGQKEAKRLSQQWVQDEISQGWKQAGAPREGYFKEIAGYIQQLTKSSIRRKFQGNLYRTDIPDELIPKMLDWDKPLSEQAPVIRMALQDAFKRAETAFNADPQNVTKAESVARLRMVLDKELNLTGQKIYETLHSVAGHGSENASKFLNDLGIPGIKYLDQGSRQAGQGTRNFVVFDPAILQKTERIQ